jgi:hypothetical protein
MVLDMLKRDKRSLLCPLRRMGQNLPSGKGLYSFDKYVYTADEGEFARSNALDSSTFHLVSSGVI